MTNKFARVGRTITALALASTALTAGAVSFAQPSEAATAASYRSDALPSDIFTVRLYQNSNAFTIPTSAPSTATITTVDASWNYINRPYYDLTYVWLCTDANAVCAQIKGPNGNQVSGATVTGITTFTGKPISTKLHWVTYVDDGQTGTLHAALNPGMYAATPQGQPLSNYATIGYSY